MIQSNYTNGTPMKVLWPIRGMDTDRRRDGQRGQGDRESDTAEADSLRRTRAHCRVDESGFGASSQGWATSLQGEVVAQKSPKRSKRW